MNVVILVKEGPDESIFKKACLSSWLMCSIIHKFDLLDYIFTCSKKCALYSPDPFKFCSTTFCKEGGCYYSNLNNVLA